VEKAAVFGRFFRSKQVSIITGVPDSVLAGLIDQIDADFSERHVIAANEGSALSIALGNFLANKGPGVVYLQNSGLGNLLNPIASIAHQDVCGIPVFLVIGWRGEPGVADEPQHTKQGGCTTDLLDLLDIPWWVIEPHADTASVLEFAWSEMLRRESPVAVLVRSKFFKATQGEEKRRAAFEQPQMLQREQAIELLLDLIQPDDVIISTTGKTSRELHNLRASRNEVAEDFLTVGGMGHASSIALGVALAQPDRRVVCLDGDGAALMHLGAVATIGARKPRNFVHVLFNNRAHESVGGQPTASPELNFEALSAACDYEHYVYAENDEQLRGAWVEVTNRTGPAFLEISIAQGSNPSLGRPTETPAANKTRFRKKIGT